MKATHGLAAPDPYHIVDKRYVLFHLKCMVFQFTSTFSQMTVYFLVREFYVKSVTKHL